MMTYNEMIERLDNRENDIFDLVVDLRNFRESAGRNWTKKELSLLCEATDSLAQAYETIGKLKEML